MIKANELRLNNIVSYKGKVGIVKGFYENDNILSSVTVYFDQRKPVSIDELEPIPLTSEWLEGCGFIDKGPNDAAKSTWLRENIYCPSFDSFEGAFYCSDDWGAQHFAYCEYIHQLQNAVYALTGTELEIKLP